MRQTTEGLSLCYRPQSTESYLFNKTILIYSMYILLLLIISNSLHTKVTPIDALSFSFQREMTMCTKRQSIVSFFSQDHDKQLISSYTVFLISRDNCRFDYYRNRFNFIRPLLYCAPRSYDRASRSKARLVSKSRLCLLARR